MVRIQPASFGRGPGAASVPRERAAPARLLKLSCLPQQTAHLLWTEERSMCSPKLRDHPPRNVLEGICGHESAAFKLLLVWTEGSQEVGMPTHPDCRQRHIGAHILRGIS